MRPRVSDFAGTGWTALLRDGGYAARLTFVPSEDDWSTMNLPVWLAPLYVALRPRRLLRKYGMGGNRPSPLPHESLVALYSSKFSSLMDKARSLSWDER